MSVYETEFDAKKIAKKLLNLREKSGETQKEVAEAIGISASAYSMYENGERIPRDKIKTLIAKHFKTTVQKIFFT